MSLKAKLPTLVSLAGLITAAFALGASAASPIRITSTLDGKTVLPLRIHWVVRPHVPTALVKSVSFRIDGRLAWVEHNPPYVYADDGNWLVTSFLQPGTHSFSAQVTTTDGRTSTDTVRARVIAAPPPPSVLAHTWSRTVAGPPAPGTWKVSIVTEGWVMRDPQGGGGVFDVRYLSSTKIELRPTIEHPLYPDQNNGGWCSDTDPLSIYTVTVSGDGQSMTLAPANGHDPCADRANVIAGTWSRANRG
jgi:hypothetical protein